MSVANVKNPDEIECTLSFTLRLREWKKIKQTLLKNSAWAEMELISDISDLVSQLEDTFYPKSKD